MTRTDKMIFAGCVAALGIFLRAMRRAQVERLRAYDEDDTWADATR